MGDRVSVYPSRLALQNMKVRLSASQKGVSLLKKRADALAFHYRAHASKALHNILEVTLRMKQARISMASSQFLGNQTALLLETLPKESRMRYSTHTENITGVRLVIFDRNENEDFHSTSELAGLSCGGEQLKICRTVFEHALTLLVQQAALRFALKAIDNMYSSTNRRVNGIEHVVIPKVERTIRFIISELDEEEREEYFRRKKVQMKKRIKKPPDELRSTERVATMPPSSVQVQENVDLTPEGKLDGKSDALLSTSVLVSVPVPVLVPAV